MEVGMFGFGTMTRRWFAGACMAVAAASVSAAAQAADKVKVGVFPISSSLPYFVATNLGYFKEVNIEPEMSTLMGGPPNVAAMITNQIEVSAVLVTLEGLNANLKKPGVAMYISLNSQNATYRMEQFVVRNGLKVESLKDLKGLKLMTSPGPANLNTAKGVLAKVGLKDGATTPSTSLTRASTSTRSRPAPSTPAIRWSRPRPSSRRPVRAGCSKPA
jgi:NitT/TauT family transport system substrate-binding protein